MGVTIVYMKVYVEHELYAGIYYWKNIITTLYM